MWSGLGEARPLLRLNVGDFAISHDDQYAVFLLLVFNELFVSLFEPGNNLVSEF